MWWLLLSLLVASALDPQALYERAVRLPTYAPWRDATFEAARRISLIKRAIELEPTNALYRMALCELLPPGDPGREAELERLAELPDPAIKRWALWMLASDALLRGEARKALDLLRRAPPDPENALLDLESASCLLKLGRGEEAARTFLKAAAKPSLRLYKSPARLDMEEAHPHFAGTPISILALSSRLKETALSLLDMAKDKSEARKLAKASLRLSLLLARSGDIPAAPEAASQIAAEALEVLAKAAQITKKAKADLERKALQVRAAATSLKGVPKPEWADRLLALFTFGVGRGKAASLSRWAAWLLVPAIPSFLLGLLLSWPLGLVVRRGRPRRLVRASSVAIVLLAGTAAGVKTAWNPPFRWAEHKIARYERERRQAKAEAVSARIESVRHIPLPRERGAGG